MTLPTPPRSPRSYPVNIRLPADLYERLQATARAERNALSSVARRLLSAALPPDQKAATDESARRG
jgi:hypothetical protein